MSPRRGPSAAVHLSSAARCASIRALEMGMAISELFRMKVNPDVFFKFHEGKFVVWNYRAHEQFELTLPYLERLYAIGTAESPPATSAPPPAQAQIDDELRAAGLVSASYPSTSWGWDSLSHIFHVGTSVLL